MLSTAQKTLQQFEPVRYPRDSATLINLGYLPEKNTIQIGFPSWSNPDKLNICTYNLKDKKLDDCLCRSHQEFKLYCWHLKFRAVILKAFLNKKEGDDQSWISYLETNRKEVCGQIIEYWWSLYEHQEIVSQRDILDLELQDHFGRNIDRRVIGNAPKTMKNAGMIIKVGEVPAQYSKRKGGRVGLWKKNRNERMG